MYIIKNALKCISRSLGRNILIGIIVLVIAISSCLGLSIRQASESAREDTLSTMSVTANISYDRSSMMNSMRPGGGREASSFEGGFDRDQFAEMMGGASSLTLDEYKKYAEAESVSDFYYTVSTYLNGGEGLDPVSNETESEDEEDEEGKGNMPGGFGGFGGRGGMFQMAESGDFSIEAISSESALTSFINNTAEVNDGELFDVTSDELVCMISSDLSVYNNDLAVGDTITLVNPNDEEEVYTLTIAAIYTDSSTNEGAFSMMGSMTMSDPANKIYMSAPALQTILDASEAASETLTDEDTGREYETALTSNIEGTYVFDNTDDYYAFEEEARALGLSDSYTISSQDITAFESSLTPLETLSTMAGYFLLVILGIGAIILVVLNIFNVRERKYEIGVLTAMGMKKWKVAMQFVCEIFAVTMAAVIIGATVGAVCSVPVTNALLENQIASQSDRSQMIEENFGRGEMPEGMPDDMPEMPGGGGFGDFGEMFTNASNYVSEVNSAVNLTVLLQMLGVAILLTIVSGAVSMLFVMRYEPLKILANRD